MPVNINRRNAFAASFNQYPDILERFARDNCELVRPMTRDIEPKAEAENRAIMQILMAQFCVRLMNTRGNNATSAVEDFATGCIERYHAYTRKLIGGLIIEAPAKYRAALAEIESHMAELIMHSLAQEARIVEIAHEAYREALAMADEENPLPPDIKEPEDFDEASFWHDVFLALSQNQRKHHPLWITPIQAVVLNNLDELKGAFNVQ